MGTQQELQNKRSSGSGTTEGDRLHGGRDSAFRWLLGFIVTFVTPLAVSGKNSMAPGATASERTPVLSEGRGEVCVEDLLCARL